MRRGGESRLSAAHVCLRLERRGLLVLSSDETSALMSLGDSADGASACSLLLEGTMTSGGLRPRDEGATLSEASGSAAGVMAAGVATAGVAATGVVATGVAAVETLPLAPLQLLGLQHLAACSNNSTHQ